jgi:hypothetical protein
MRLNTHSPFQRDKGSQVSIVKRVRGFYGRHMLFLIVLLSVGLSPAWAELDLEYHEDELQPEVQVKEHDNRTVEEYRINGNLYMVKIKPKFGPAYYLVDDTGTGELDLRRTASGRDIVIPRWTLLTW